MRIRIRNPKSLWPWIRDGKLRIRDKPPGFTILFLSLPIKILGRRTSSSSRHWVNKAGGTGGLDAGGGGSGVGGDHRLLQVGVGGVEGGGVHALDEALVHARHVAQHGRLCQRNDDLWIFVRQKERMEDARKLCYIERKYEYQLNTGGKPTERNAALIQTIWWLPTTQDVRVYNTSTWGPRHYTPSIK